MTTYHIPADYPIANTDTCLYSHRKQPVIIVRKDRNSATSAAIFCGSYLTGKRRNFMSNRDEYISKMKAKLDEWNGEIDTLTAKANGVAADVKNEYAEHIESLKAKQAATRQKIEELQHAGEGAWEDVKSGIDLAWTAMGEAIDSARSRFK
jgi:hypothetical protein